MTTRIAALKRCLTEAYAAQETALESGDAEAMRLASERVRTADLVLRRLKGERLARPVYLIAGFTLVVAGALALLPLQRPEFSLTAMTSAVALQIDAKEVDMLPGAVSLSSLQFGSNEAVEACQQDCKYSRIEMETLRANARTLMQLRAEGGCLMVDVTEGVVSVMNVHLFSADRWDQCKDCNAEVQAGQTLRMCGLQTPLLVPVRRVSVADERRPIGDAAASATLIEGTLNLVDLGSKRELAPGTLIEIAELSDGYATVAIPREIELRVTGKAGKLLIGSKKDDVRPSLLQTVSRAPDLLEWSSLLTGMVVFIVGLRGRLGRAREVLEGEL